MLSDKVYIERQENEHLKAGTLVQLVVHWYN